MDPSYTNGVGTQVPPNNPQMSGQPMQQPVMTPGQPMQSQSASVRQSPVRQIPIQQVPSENVIPQQPVISSGTDDVIISNTPEKKSRKGLIILIVLGVLLLLGVGGFLLWQNGTFNGGTSPKMVGLQERYNSYVNYVLWGVESNGKPDREEMGVIPYFENLDRAALDGYIEKANNKFAELSALYEQEPGENKANLEILRVYFEDYAKIRAFTYDDVLDVFATYGQEAADKAIEANFEMAKDNQYLKDYADAITVYWKSYLEILVKANAAGCVNEGKVVPGCYVLTEDEKTKLDDSRFEASDKAADLRIEVSWEMDDLYDELYGEADSEDDVSGEEGGEE